jgi:hypothetical protein
MYIYKKKHFLGQLYSNGYTERSIENFLCLILCFCADCWQIFKIIFHILLRNIIYILNTYYLRRQRLAEINNLFVFILIMLFVFTYHVVSI